MCQDSMVPFYLSTPQVLVSELPQILFVLLLIQCDQRRTEVLGHCYVHCITAPQTVSHGNIHCEFCQRFV